MPLLFIFWIILVGIFFGLTCWRYYLRKLKKVKKSNGQVLAINEVIFLHLLVLYCVSLFQFDWHKDAISFEICIDNDRFNSGAKQVSWTFNVKFMWSKLIKIKCECTLIRDRSSSLRCFIFVSSSLWICFKQCVILLNEKYLPLCFFLLIRNSSC